MPRYGKPPAGKFPPTNFPFDQTPDDTLPPQGRDKVPFLNLGPSLDIITSIFPGALFPDEGGGLSVLINAGDATFTAVQTIADAPTHTIALGDVDGDGDLDALRTDPNEDSVAVYLNDGSGQFSQAGTVALPVIGGFSSGAQGIALGDLDGDGDLDAVVAAGAEEAAVLINDGAGEFSVDSILLIGDNPTGVALGDLDGDGDLDAAVAAGFDAVIRILLNDGTGELTRAFNFATAGEFISAVLLADMDNDGDLDLITESIENDSFIEIGLNDGSGAFPNRVQIPVNGSSVTRLAVGDIDGDGDLDILATTFTDVLVFKNEVTGDGPVMTLAQTIAFTHIDVVKLGDIDGDGDLDALVSADFEPDEGIHVLANNGHGSFREVDFLPLDAPFDFALGFLDEPVAPNSVPDPAGLLLV